MFDKNKCLLTKYRVRLAKTNNAAPSMCVYFICGDLFSIDFVFAVGVR